MCATPVLNANSGLRPSPWPVTVAYYYIIWPHDLREIERIVFENRKTLINKYHEYHNL